MARRIGWCLGLLLLLSCSHTPPAAPPADAFSGATAFVDVTLVPMDSERLVPGQTVIVRDGRIAALGPTASTPVPPGAQRIEGHGKYLMPGLADMHVHLFFMAEGDLRVFLANGVTFIRGMWGSPRDVQWRERIARGELLGPTLFTAGPLVDGSPPTWNESAVAESFAEGERLVAEQKQAGYDFIKVYNRLSPEAYAGVVAAAKREGLFFAGHVPFSVGLEGALSAGQRSIEHLAGYLEWLQAEDSEVRGKQDWASRQRQIDFVDEAKLPSAIEATKRAGVWNCPTLILTRRYVSPDEARVLARQPEMRFVPPAVRAMWDPSQDFRLKDLKAEDFARMRRRDALLLKVTRALRDAGAHLLLGTDTGNPYVFPGFSVHEELALLVQAGLTPYEALRAGTRDAAEFVGRLDEFGTVEVGKRADLLLLDANPLENVAHVQRRGGVMARGRWLPEAELRAMLEEVASSYAAPKDRFEGAQPLLTEGEPLFSARYELLIGDTPTGEERLTLRRLPDGRRLLASQAAYDPPQEERSALRMELTPGGEVNLLTYAVRDNTGEANLRLERSGGRVRVSGKSFTQARVSQEAEAVPDLHLRVPLVAADLLLAERLRGLAPGQKLRVLASELSASREPALREVTLDFQRIEDGSELLAGKQVRVRRFALEQRQKQASYKGVLALDAEGRPATLELQMNMGLFRYRRLE